MKSGIYCYKDLQNNNEIVYIGKDSNIHKNERHRQHLHPSLYNQQQINRILQNNPKRYKYEILKQWKTSKFHKNLANVLEILYIKRYNPKFNFTIGGEGLTGKKHTNETKKKMSENHHKYWKGKKHTQKYKQKMSNACKGLIPWNKNKKLPQTHKTNISQARNKTNYYRVTIEKNKKLKQGFCYRYQYYDENGKHKKITSVNIKKLEKKVLEKGLEWFK